MAIPQTLEHGRSESFMHLIARDFQWLLRGLCVLLLIGTAVAMVVFWYAAIPLVLLLVLCYVLLVIADGVEQHTTDEPTAAPPSSLTIAQRVRANEAAVAAQAHQAAEEQRVTEQRRRLEPRLTRIAIEVLVGALVLGAVGAGLAIDAFGWKLLPIALLVLTGYAILVTAPMWLAWMEDDVDEASTEPQMKAPVEEQHI